jgi:hypothetical protein
MKKILLILFAAFAVQSTFGQKHLAISAGIGIPELINAGLRYGTNQNQFAISLGTVWSKEDPTIAKSLDYYRHFGGKSQLSERKPWFMKFGLNYLKSDSDFLIEKYGYLNLSIGREFNITRNFGMQFHGGTIFQIYEKIIEKQPSYGFDINISIPVLPCLGIATFYKFGVRKE